MRTPPQYIIVTYSVFMGREGYINYDLIYKSLRTAYKFWRIYKRRHGLRYRAIRMQKIEDIPETDQYKILWSVRVGSCK